MRIAVYVQDQQRRIGLVSEDGLTVQTLDVPAEVAERGVLGLMGLSVISCLGHNMHSRSDDASQDEDPAGGIAGDPGRTA